MTAIAFILRISSDESFPNSYLCLSVQKKKLFDVPVVDYPMCLKTSIIHVCVCVCVCDQYETDLPKMLTMMDIGHRQF